MKKRIFSFFSAFILLISFSFAQSQDTQYGVWELMSKKDGIEVYGKHDLCLIDHAPNDYHFLNIKIINTTELEKEISLYVKHYYQEGETGETVESLIKTRLEPNQTLEGSCANEESPYLTRFIVNPKFKDSWHYIQSKIIFESIK